MAFPQPAAAFMARQIERLRGAGTPRKIVFPEGEDSRVIEAAAHLAGDRLLHPILVGRAPASAPAGVEFIEPAKSPLLKKYAALLYDKRRHKGVTQVEAEKLASGPLHFAALMTAAGGADGFVGSAVYTTADTARAVYHCIDMQPKCRRLSSVHILAVHDPQYGHKGLLAFSDAAIMASPSAVELAEIAIATATTARSLFDTEPLVALLSFSTKGSAKHKDVDKVVSALEYIRQRAPELQVDGELQADAALVPFVGQKKSPGSRVAGMANVLIFPDLDAANIGYKLVERLGDAALLGVFVQGVVKPVSIISRGCTAEDAVNASILTAVQTLGERAAAS
jgi:phosphate acetyltransferase